MQLKHKAIAGTLESSDAQIILAPNDGGLHIDLTSSVYEQYGTQIKQLLQQVCRQLNIENANIRVVDKGALDCTLKARLETAYFRAIDQKVDINWEALS
ncbi:MAG: citrate lyase acyl carrier protein [Lactobacillus sp.]|jgi:citrate lyase subunit gamma (acyl carrier protein)|nr:citrate lyase acyl carrier protein [Lactobacillus sp.]